MSNILEYTLSLNDKFSATMRKIGVNSDMALNTFGKLQTQATKVKTTLNSMGTSVGSLTQKLELLKAERDWIPAKNLTDLRKYNTEIKLLENRITRLQTVSSKPIKNMFSNAFSSIPFANLLTNPLVAAGALAAGAFSVGFKNDMAGVAFETLLGSKDAGKKMVEDIRKYANITPFETLPLQENAKMMLAFGIASEKILPNIKMLGDVAMGDAEKMSSLTLAFSQAASAGKLNGQDLLQMINAGFNPLQEISKKTGKSMAELRKEMEKGNIPFSMVEEAFKTATGEGGKFYKMTEKMGESPMGKWSTFIDSLKNNLLKLYDVLRPLIVPALNLLTKISGWLGIALEWVVSSLIFLKNKLVELNPWMVTISIAIGSIVAGLMLQSLWTGILVVKTALWTSALWLKNAAIAAYTYLSVAATTATSFWQGAQFLLNATFAACPLWLIIAGVLVLIGFIAYLIYKIDGWREAWQQLLNYLDLSLQIFKTNFELIWLGVQDTFLTGVEYIKKAWYELKSLWDEDSANSELAKINSEQNKRAEEIAKAKNKYVELLEQRADINVFSGLKWNDKSLKDITGGLKDKLGISAPTIPGTTNSGTTASNTASKTEGASETIASGGTRNTSIEITFKNMVESIIYNGGADENKSDFEKQVTESLLRVLSMAYSVA